MKEVREEEDVPLRQRLSSLKSRPNAQQGAPARHNRSEVPQDPRLPMDPSLAAPSEAPARPMSLEAALAVVLDEIVANPGSKPLKLLLSKLKKQAPSGPLARPDTPPRPPPALTPILTSAPDAAPQADVSMGDAYGPALAPTPGALTQGGLDAFRQRILAAGRGLATSRRAPLWDAAQSDGSSPRAGGHSPIDDAAELERPTTPIWRPRRDTTPPFDVSCLSSFRRQRAQQQAAAAAARGADPKGDDGVQAELRRAMQSLAKRIQPPAALPAHAGLFNA